MAEEAKEIEEQVDEEQGDEEQGDEELEIDTGVDVALESQNDVFPNIETMAASV